MTNTTKATKFSRLIVTDLCGRTRADVPWDGSRGDVLAGARALAAQSFGDVMVVTASGYRLYADEAGL